MVPADSRRIPRVPRYSGYRYAAFRFTYWTITVYGHIFQSVLFTICIQCRGPTTPLAPCDVNGLGCSPFARLPQAQNFVFRFRGFANTHKHHFLKASFQNCCFVRAVFAFRKSSLKEIFKGYCCLLFNYQGSFHCSFQATASIFYQKLFSLSRTFLFFCFV